MLLLCCWEGGRELEGRVNYMLEQGKTGESLPFQLCCKTWLSGTVSVMHLVGGRIKGRGGKEKERNETKSESVKVKMMITFLSHNLLRPGRI